MIDPKFKKLIAPWGIKGVDVFEEEHTGVQGHWNAPFLKLSGGHSGVPFTMMLEIINTGYSHSSVSLVFQKFKTWNCIFYKSTI